MRACPWPAVFRIVERFSSEDVREDHARPASAEVEDSFVSVAKRLEDYCDCDTILSGPPGVRTESRFPRPCTGRSDNVEMDSGMLFTGNYHFFDYKYDIEGYAGQDAGGMAQILFPAASLVLLVLLLTLLRKTPEEKARRIVGWLGIFLTVFYAAKTTWESGYDIARTGAFNTGLLPLDLCSMIMPTGILTGFGRGKIRQMAAAWVSTGGILGGLATMVQLNAFRYYPMLSFGAFYSMLWHFLMVFMGLLLRVTAGRRPDAGTVLDGFRFHLLFSALVIPVDFLFGFDFMFYREMGGLPFLSGLAASLAQQRMALLTPVIMLAVYFAMYCLIAGTEALFGQRGETHGLRQAAAGRP